MVAFSLRHPKIIFVHIPKSGGTSVSQAIKDAYPGSYVRKGVFIDDLKKRSGKTHVRMHGHMSASIMREAFPEQWNNWYTLCMVRNPWARLVSIWNHILQDPKLFRMAYGYKEDDFIHMHMEEEQKKTFKEWVLSYDKPMFWYGAYRYGTRREEALPVTQTPQLDWIYSSDGIKRVNDIFKLEESDKFIDSFERRFGKKLEFKHMNLRDHKPYRDLYDSDLVDIVSEWYKSDIEEFGYSF